MPCWHSKSFLKPTHRNVLWWEYINAVHLVHWQCNLGTGLTIIFVLRSRRCFWIKGNHLKSGLKMKKSTEKALLYTRPSSGSVTADNQNIMDTCTRHKGCHDTVKWKCSVNLSFTKRFEPTEQRHHFLKMNSTADNNWLTQFWAAGLDNVVFYPQPCHTHSPFCSGHSCFSHSSYQYSSSSNWILMSCQPHRVTSGQSNSGHKQIHINSSHVYIYMNPLSSQFTKPITSQTNHTYKHQLQIFEELVPSILPLLKEHIRLGHAGIVDHSV